MKQPGTPWTPFQFVKAVHPGVSDAAASLAMSDSEVMVQNSRYAVIAELDVSGMATEEFPDGMPLIHLSIRRNDRKVLRSWRDLQRIKSELCGSTCEAVELFPEEERVLDGANQYHLWVFPPGVRVPIGVNSGRQVADDDDVEAGLLALGLTGDDVAGVMSKARQEPFEDGKDAGRYEPGLLEPLWKQVLVVTRQNP